MLEAGSGQTWPTRADWNYLGCHHGLERVGVCERFIPFMKMDRRLLDANTVCTERGVWVGLERVEESKVLHIPILCDCLVFRITIAPWAFCLDTLL